MLSKYLYGCRNCQLSCADSMAEALFDVCPEPEISGDGVKAKVFISGQLNGCCLKVLNKVSNFYLEGTVLGAYCRLNHLTQRTYTSYTHSWSFCSNTN